MSSLTRSRWAAIGAAIAVTLGAGTAVVINADTPTASAFVPITPTRVLDTRTDTGLDGVFTSPAARNLTVTGTIATTTGTRLVVPPGATGVTLNLTAIAPTAPGFVAVRPAGTPGPPTTSNLNLGLDADQIVANAVTVQLPTTGATAGAIELTYDAYGIAGPTVDLLADIVGY